MDGLRSVQFVRQADYSTVKNDFSWRTVVEMLQLVLIVWRILEILGLNAGFHGSTEISLDFRDALLILFSGVFKLPFHGLLRMLFTVQNTSVDANSIIFTLPGIQGLAFDGWGLVC
jgi:hypothetical protein